VGGERERRIRSDTAILAWRDEWIWHQLWYGKKTFAEEDQELSFDMLIFFREFILLILMTQEF
jgi:hypothetical protein